MNKPRSDAQVVQLGELLRIDVHAQTEKMARAQLPDDVAVVVFALLETSMSRDHRRDVSIIRIGSAMTICH